MVKVENISKRYGDHYAVKNLSFEIEKGQVYGFLGPNGAGKSTTMNIMTGYIAASEGIVEINGHDILKDAEEAKKCIGYLPELPPLYMDMTVKEYLSFAAELKGITKAERKEQIAEVMDKTFITDMANRLIKNLSKGYKQRVGLAQAMLGNPDIIILDEPTVGLDPKQINEIRDLIRSLKEDHAVILSSHILSEVSEVCDKLIFIAGGKLVANGTPQTLLAEMGQKGALELTVKGNKNRVKSVIDSITGIEDCSYKLLSNGCTECNITVNDNCEIRDELFEKLSKENMPIYRLNPVDRSLEDIFLELTDEKNIPSDLAKEEE